MSHVLYRSINHSKWRDNVLTTVFLNKELNKNEFEIILKNLIVMFLGRRELFLRVVLTGFIGICSFIGDQGLKYGKTAATRAIFDNVTHAIVGGLTWAVILNLSKKSLIQNFSSIFCSFCLSSFVDVDHFIAACSWKLSVSNVITFYV